MKRLLLTGAIAAGALLSACSTTETDFAKAAEEVIKRDGPGLLGGELTEITCKSPDSKDVGTEFGCTATGPAGEALTFTAMIVAEDRISVEPDV